MRHRDLGARKRRVEPLPSECTCGNEDTTGWGFYVDAMTGSAYHCCRDCGKLRGDPSAWRADGAPYLKRTYAKVSYDYASSSPKLARADADTHTFGNVYKGA